MEKLNQRAEFEPRVLNAQIEAVAKVIQAEAAADGRFPVEGLANYAAMAERIINALSTYRAEGCAKCHQTRPCKCQMNGGYFSEQTSPPPVDALALLREARPYIESFARLTKHPTAGDDALVLRDKISEYVRTASTKCEGGSDG
jgi:hypothetical protein